MQIFILDKNPVINARYYSNKHMKIILEATQILCNVVNLTGGKTPYNSTHLKHPISLWAFESLSNWKWIKNFIAILNEENKYRYGKDHKSALVAKDLKEPDIPDIGLTSFPLAMPDVYKYKDDIVKSYRRYYVCEKKYFKSGIAQWKNRPIPYWMKG